MNGSTTFFLRTFCSVITAVLLAGAGTPCAQIALPPDESRTLGTQVPDVTLISEDSLSFPLSALAGKPVVVSPIFTTCPHTCALITENLRDALTAIGEPGVGYQVLTVSFDPADGPAALREYRRRMELPDGWTLAVASEENRRALLDAIDFHYEALPGGGFAHANVVAILTPTLEVSGYAHGVTYESPQLRAALEKATRASSLVRHYRPYIFLAGALAFIALAVTLLVTRRRTSAA